MARGRIISRTLGSSRCFANLAKHAGKLTEFAQALYPMVIVHSDDHGRQHGDAFTIKHAVWPTSPRAEDDFDKALTAMDRAGLVKRYAVNAVIYLQVLNFDDHQQGLHKRRASKFPEVPGKAWNAPENPGRTDTDTDTDTELEPEPNGARDEDGLGDFDAFWQAYPKRTKRPDAEKAWRQVHPKISQMPAIFAAILRGRASASWLKDDGQFIPYPASWLRNRRWEDEPEKRPARINGVEQQPDYHGGDDGECQHTPRCTSGPMHRNALKMGRTA